MSVVGVPERKKSKIHNVLSGILMSIKILVRLSWSRKHHKLPFSMTVFYKPGHDPKSLTDFYVILKIAYQEFFVSKKIY